MPLKFRARRHPTPDVPVYLLIGRHDVNASLPLLKSSYSVLEAPREEIVWFERSGNPPWSSEPARCVTEVVERARAGRSNRLVV